MKKIVFILLSVALFMSACGPKISEEQQSRLESITVTVDSIATALNDVDSTKLEQTLKDFFKRKDIVENKLKDTIPYEIIFKVDSFVELRRELKFIRNEFNIIKSEANMMNSQIKDLNHDVAKRLVEEKQFERYYELEKKNTQQLQDAASQLFIRINRVEKYYPRLVPLIDSLIAANNIDLNE